MSRSSHEIRQKRVTMFHVHDPFVSMCLVISYRQVVSLGKGGGLIRDARLSGDPWVHGARASHLNLLEDISQSWATPRAVNPGSFSSSTVPDLQCSRLLVVVVMGWSQQTGWTGCDVEVTLRSRSEAIAIPVRRDETVQSALCYGPTCCSRSTTWYYFMYHSMCFS